MNIKKIAFLCLVLVCTFFALTSCSKKDDNNSSVPAFSGTQVEKADKISVGDVVLRDKKLLYSMYDNTEVVTMYLTVTRGNDAENTNHSWEEINSYSVFDYEEMGVDRYQVAGLLQVGDENGLIPGELGYDQVSPNCTIQIRGQSSSRSPQKNYKIAIKDNKGTWRGQKTLALNKHATEGLRFRNKLAYDLMCGIDQMFALRTTFVHLYVRDLTDTDNAQFEDYGLYTQVEQLNKTALRTHGLDRNGHLYKINLFEFLRYEDVIKLTTDPDFDYVAFETLIETKGDDDHSKLISLLDRINDYSIPIETILEENFDIENLSYWMAFHMLFGNIDTQNRNVYIHSPLNSEKWYFLSWDNDGSLKRKEFEFTGRTDYTEWESGVSNYWGNTLFRRCLKSEIFRQHLDAAVEDLRNYLSEERVVSLANTYASIVKPYVYSVPDALNVGLTPDQYDAVVQSLYPEICDNYVRYKDSFKKPMPFYIAVPQKTKDGKINIIWDSSFTFDSSEITYSFELAKDYSFANPILKLEDIKIPSVTFDALPKGQYFVRVLAKNEAGLTQTAFDTYVLANGKVYGTKCFYVDAKGNVSEEKYVET